MLAWTRSWRRRRKAPALDQDLEAVPTGASPLEALPTSALPSEAMSLEALPDAALRALLAQPLPADPSVAAEAIRRGLLVFDPRAGWKMTAARH